MAQMKRSVPLHIFFWGGAPIDIVVFGKQVR